MGAAPPCPGDTPGAGGRIGAAGLCATGAATPGFAWGTTPAAVAGVAAAGRAAALAGVEAVGAAGETVVGLRGGAPGFGAAAGPAGRADTEGLAVEAGARGAAGRAGLALAALAASAAASCSANWRKWRRTSSA